MIQPQNNSHSPEKGKQHPKITNEEVVKEWFPQGEKRVERLSLTQQEKEDKLKLKKEIEKIYLPSEKLSEIKQRAEELTAQPLRDKIVHLLGLAKKKGLTYALKMARETNDPLTIDLFHDILAKNHTFEKFTQ